MNSQRIQRNIETNAKGWFEYVNGERGRQTRHLYVVTGCDKTSDWGVTSFSTRSWSNEVRLQFTTGIVGVGPSYSWSTSCNTLASFCSSQPSPNKVKAQNQCVFIHGFTLTQNLKTPRPFSKSTGGIRIRDLCDSKPWKNSKSRWGFGSFSSALRIQPILTIFEYNNCWTATGNFSFVSVQISVIFIHLEYLRHRMGPMRLS